MKNFSQKYLNPVSKIKNFTPFPLEPYTQDIIDYLKLKGFREAPCEYWEHCNLNQIILYSEEVSKKLYPAYLLSIIDFKDSKGKYGWIRFWQKPISKESPMYFVKTTEDGHMPDNIGSSMGGIEYDGIRYRNIQTYEEFKNMIELRL